MPLLTLQKYNAINFTPLSLPHSLFLSSSQSCLKNFNKSSSTHTIYNKFLYWNQIPRASFSRYFSDLLCGHSLSRIHKIGTNGNSAAEPKEQADSKTPGETRGS